MGKNPEQNSNQSLGSISFRHMIDRFDKEVRLDSEDLYADHIDDDSSNKPPKALIERETKIEPFNPIAFFKDFFFYFASRMRLVFLFMSILAEILSVQSENAKNLVVRKMYWGRGLSFKLFAQLGVFILVFVVTISTFYRTNYLDNEFVVYAVEDEVTVATQTNSDLIVQNNSVKTVIPTNRMDRDFDRYIVKIGDSLGAIAAANELNVETLQWANNLTGQAIKPGMELVIPPAKGVLVKVASGDTVESLSKKYEGSPDGIVQFNLLDEPYTLAVGSEIFIPDGRKPTETIARTTQRSAYIRGGNLNTNVTVGSQPQNNVQRFLTVWPVEGGGAVSRCGLRSHPPIDIYGGTGRILAAAAGTVTYAGCTPYGWCRARGEVRGGSDLGWMVKINHGNGYETVYAHLRDFNVQNGQSVSAGQPIGIMGATGLSYGVHLHFALVRAGSNLGSQLNPGPYLTDSHSCG